MSSLALPQLKLPSAVKTKFWKKRSVTISDLDPQYRVTYLGNVLTGWAKGEGCADKPLSTLWRNHTSSDKPHIAMKVTICAQGLKAVTKEHGLTEYWANRITYCAADPNYPKVFCWIYRHEGRKMKQELRCHAVLCPSSNKARSMASLLQQRLHQALVDFRKEKLSRQNARLSLANSVYDAPSMPFRKILLHTGSSNYRPALERGKAAPRLKAIEEEDLQLEEETTQHELCRSASTPNSNMQNIIEEEEEEEEETNDAYSDAATDVTSLASSTVCGDVSVGVLVDLEQHVPSTFAIGMDDEDDDDEESEEDKDEITNYLPDDATVEAVNTALSRVIADDVEVDSAASVSPDSNQFSTSGKKSKPDKLKEELEEEVDCLAGEVRLLRLSSEQDAISDESGYSEESSPSTVGGSRVQQQQHLQQQQHRHHQHPQQQLLRKGGMREIHSGKTTLVTLNASPKKSDEKGQKDDVVEVVEADDGNDDDEDDVDHVVEDVDVDSSSTQCDLTVRSAMMDDRTAASRDFLLHSSTRITEFCINI